jgi:hypothetical protein
MFRDRGEGALKARRQRRDRQRCGSHALQYLAAHRVRERCQRQAEWVFFNHGRDTNNSHNGPWAAANSGGYIQPTH